jgi:hypothetical protein
MSPPALLLTLAACAPPLAARIAWSNGAPQAGRDAPVAWPDTGEDPTTPVSWTVDATDREAWVHLDLDAGETVAAADPWDLRVRRFEVHLNGGVHGDGGVEATFTEGLAFDEATAAPEAGWATDAPDADEDGLPEAVFDEWYDYDVETHVLTPKARTYFVRSTEGDVYRLVFLSYYDDAGTPGVLHLRLGWLAAAPPTP